MASLSQLSDTRVMKYFIQSNFLPTCMAYLFGFLGENVPKIRSRNFDEERHSIMPVTILSSSPAAGGFSVTRDYDTRVRHASETPDPPSTIAQSQRSTR